MAAMAAASSAPRSHRRAPALLLFAAGTMVLAATSWGGSSKTLPSHSRLESSSFLVSPTPATVHQPGIARHPHHGDVSRSRRLGQLPQSDFMRRTMSPPITSKKIMRRDFVRVWSTDPPQPPPQSNTNGTIELETDDIIPSEGLWNDDLSKFVGEQDATDDYDMEEVMKILKDKGGYGSELEEQLAQDLDVDVVQNRKYRKMLVDEENGKLTEDFDRALEAIFDAYDLDEDGALSFSEMAAMWVKTNGSPMPQGFWDEAKAGIDTNQNGITRKGFYEFYKLQATIDAVETVKDLQALGFAKEFPDIEITEADFIEFAQEPPPEIQIPEGLLGIGLDQNNDDEGPDYEDDLDEDDVIDVELEKKGGS